MWIYWCCCSLKSVIKIKTRTNLSHVYVLQVSLSFLCCRRCRCGHPLSTPPMLTLTLQHLQQPLNALITGAQCLLLRVDPHPHFLHGLPELEQLLGLTLVLRLQPGKILLCLIQRWRWAEAVAIGHLAAGAAGIVGGRPGWWWCLAGGVEGSVGAVPQTRQRSVCWAGPLCRDWSAAAVTWAVNDDVSFLLSRIIGVGRTNSEAVLKSRAVQVVGAMPGTGTRTKVTSVVLLHMKLPIRAGVPLLMLPLQATVHLPVSFQLLLQLLHCQWKRLQKQSKVFIFKFTKRLLWYYSKKNGTEDEECIHSTTDVSRT